MTRSATTAALLGALGHRTSKAAGAAGLAHRISLIAAAAAVVVTAWMFAGAAALFAGQDSRLVEREPQVLPAGHSDGAVARYLPRTAFHQDRQFLIIYVAPLVEQAAPPPGLARWPQPGEAFLSPALDAADATLSLRQRFGGYGGLIAPAGLVDPGEWVVYARPASDGLLTRYEGRTLIKGFGNRPGPDDDFRSVLPSQHSPSEMFLLLLIVVMLPAAVLVMVAVRSGSEQRDRRVALLHALGAPRRKVAWVVMGEASLPVLTGAIAAAAAAYATTLADIRLPVVGYTTSGTDLATISAWLPALAVVCSGIVLLLIAAAHWRQRPMRGTRPQQTAAGWQIWPRIIFLLAMGAAIWSAATAYQRGETELDSTMAMIFIPSVIICLATTPAAVSAVARPLGQLIAHLGWRAGNVAPLVAGRWLMYRTADLARVCAAFVVGLGALALIQVWVSQDAASAQIPAQSNAITSQLVTIRASNIELDADRFTSNIGQDRVLRVEQDDRGQQTIVGTCAALRNIGELATCPAAPTAATAALGKLTAVGAAMRAGKASILLHGEPKISTSSVDGTELTGLLVYNPDQATGFHRIAATAYKQLAMPDVHTAEQHTIGGNLRYAQTFSWLWAIGAIGILMLLTTTVISAIDAFLSQARSAGPLSAMSASYAIYTKIALWNIALPTAVASLGGAAIAGLLGFLLTRLRSSGSVSWQLIGSAQIAIAATGILMAVLCGHAAARIVARWRPTAD